jgi:hypothetical protein
VPDNPGCFAALAGAQAATGRPDLAEDTLATMRGRFAEHLVSPYVLALAATHSGRHDEAFALLARADEERDPNALEIPLDVGFRALHGDRRWPSLVAGFRAPPERRRPRAGGDPSMPS